MRQLVVALVLLAPSVSFACGMRATKMPVVTVADLEAVFDDIDAPAAAPAAPVQAEIVAPPAPPAPAATPTAATPAIPRS